MIVARMFLLIILAVSNSASAGDIDIVEWHGHKVLKLTGAIDAGTEQRLADQLGQVQPLPYGLPVLLLDSPGGSVGEAMRISALLDARPVHTVVPDGAKCASACASVIFIAGKDRTVEDGGLLGQHSCSLNGVPDKACNDALSQHAVEHGVSYGSVEAFVTYVPPENVLWFSREDAEGWGLTRYPGEDLSGFEKSEPRVLKMISGRMPATQSAWRIDFREDGYEAFSRTVSDFEHEMQIDVFCSEKNRGHLTIAMEVNGPVASLKDAVMGLSVSTNTASWNDVAPVIRQKDEQISEIDTEVPKKRLKSFLTGGGKLTFSVALKKPYVPMVAKTWLSDSKRVLLFAAKNCIDKHL